MSSVLQENQTVKHIFILQFLSPQEVNRPQTLAFLHVNECPVQCRLSAVLVSKTNHYPLFMLKVREDHVTYLKGQFTQT